MAEVESELVGPLSLVLKDTIHAGLTRLGISPGTLNERLHLWAQTHGAIAGQGSAGALFKAFRGVNSQTLSEAESAFYVAAGSPATATLNGQRYDYWSNVQPSPFATGTGDRVRNGAFPGTRPVQK